MRVYSNCGVSLPAVFRYEESDVFSKHGMHGNYVLHSGTDAEKEGANQFPNPPLTANARNLGGGNDYHVTLRNCSTMIF